MRDERWTIVVVRTGGLLASRACMASSLRQRIVEMGHTVDDEAFRQEVETIHRTVVGFGDQVIESATHHYVLADESLVSADRGPGSDAPARTGGAHRRHDGGGFRVTRGAAPDDDGEDGVAASLKLTCRRQK